MREIELSMWFGYALQALSRPSHLRVTAPGAENETLLLV